MLNLHVLFFTDCCGHSMTAETDRTLNRILFKHLSNNRGFLSRSGESARLKNNCFCNDMC